jgi:para-nitrobenzyl esterase
MEAILADLGLAPSEAGRLRDLPAAHMLDILTRVTPRATGVAYGPVADGTDIPADPEAVIADGSAAGIPLLVGTNLEEYKFFRRMDGAVESLTDETLLARLADPGPPPRPATTPPSTRPKPSRSTAASGCRAARAQSLRNSGSRS